MAPYSRLWPLLLRLFLPLPCPSTPPALRVSGGGCCCACGAAGDSLGIAVTSQQTGASGPFAGDLSAVGTGHGPEQDGRQQ